MNRWRKSSYSGGNNDCVEVAGSRGRVLVRDTKAREMGHMSVPAGRWHAFLNSVKRGTLWAAGDRAAT